MTKFPSFHSESGSSMVSMIMIVGLSVGVTAMVGKVTTFSQKSTINMDANDSLQMAKLMVMKKLDCKKSLGINVIPESGLECRDYKDKFTLRTADGTRLPNIGQWKIRASCPRTNSQDANELIISMTRSGKDPLTRSGTPR